MNVVTQRVRWLRSALPALTGVAISVCAAYLLVTPSGSFAGLAVVNWFWVAILTAPCVLYFAVKRQRVGATAAVCVCSLAFAVYAYGATRAMREDRKIEAVQRITRPVESPETAVGGAAPEIEAADLSGTRMRLSEHRGKVVLLVFWASWCGPCMRDVAHEKELVEHFKGRPFVIVGVNGDHTKEHAVSTVQAHAIPWRSFWNGGDDGPITRQWGIQAWPSLFVIDDEGVIRHNYLRGSELDGPLEKLVSAAEARERRGPGR
jgi:peroxiredoxin